MAKTAIMYTKKAGRLVAALLGGGRDVAGVAGAAGAAAAAEATAVAAAAEAENKGDTQGWTGELDPTLFDSFYRQRPRKG